MKHVVIWLGIVIGSGCLGGISVWAQPRVPKSDPMEEGEMPASGMSEEEMPVSRTPSTIPLRSFGGGIGVWQLPEDADFQKGSRLPLDLFVDFGIGGKFLKLRGGYNFSQASLKSDVLNRTITHELITHSVYLAYRYVTELKPRIEGYALAGIAYMNSELKMNQDLGSETSSGLGMMMGLGVVYSMENWGVGIQGISLARNGEFRGVTVATGTNQIQLVGRRPF